MQEKFDLSIKHPDFVANEELRELSRTLYEGKREEISGLIRAGTYESDEFFKKRRDQFVYENLLKPIISARIGLLTRSTPEVSVPNSVEGYLNDMDGEGTSFNQWIKEAATNADIDGISWALVDFPDVSSFVDEEGRPLINSKEDESVYNIRPLVKKVPTGSVIRWKQNEFDKELDWVVLSYLSLVDKGIGGSYEEEEKWVVWSRQSIQIYKKGGSTNKNGYELVDEKKNEIGVVPLVPFYGIKTEAPFTGIPFGYSVLDHLVKILNLESQKHYAIEQVLMPAMYIISEEKPTDVPRPEYAFWLPIGRQGQKPDVGYVEPSGRGIELCDQEIKDLINRVFRNTIYLSKKPGAQVQSADSQREETTILKSDLSSIALNHESSALRVLKLIELYETGSVSDNSQFVVHFSRDFDVRKISPQEIKELSNLANSKSISKQTLWELLVLGEVFPEKFSSDDEVARLFEEQDIDQKNLSF